MTHVQCMGICLMVSISSIAEAQPYPNRPIRFLVANAPGSSQDILARALGNALTEQIGQQVVIDARSGGSGILGIEIAKVALPDGYTMLLSSMTQFAILPVLSSNLPYDAEKDFIPLSRIASVANVLAVNASLPVGSVGELVTYAKGRAGKLNYGSAGIGTVGHLSGALFSALAGLIMVHVPYKGAPQTLADVMAGHTHVMISGPLVIMPHAKSGRIKVLATSGAKRDTLLPELPTIAETVPGYEMTNWFGVALPSRTPDAIVSALHAHVIKGLKSTKLQEHLTKQGATIEPETPAQFSAFIKAERTRIAVIGKQANIRLD